MVDDRVVIVPNAKTANNAVTTYVDTLVVELKKHYNVLEVPVTSHDLMNAINMIGAGQVRAYVSVANVGQLFKLTPNKIEIKRVLEAGQTSYIFADFDHPLLVAEHFPFMPKGSVYTNPSPAALDFARPFFGEGVGTALLPHGAELCEPLEWDQRDIACVFPGNLNYDPNVILQNWKKLPQHMQMQLHDMVDIYDAHQNDTPVPLAEIVRQVLGPVEESQDFAGYIDLVVGFDTYIRQRTRFELISNVKRAPITFIGAKWDEYPADNRTFLGQMSGADTLQTMRRAKVVLNITANYFASHERVFNAMMQTSVVGTFGDGFLKGLGGEDNDPIAYLKPDTIDEQLCELLGDDKALRERAEVGRELALTHHTWAHRAEALFAMIESGQKQF